MNELLRLTVECKKMIEHNDSDYQTKQYYRQMLLDTKLYITGLSILNNDLPKETINTTTVATTKPQVEEEEITVATNKPKGATNKPNGVTNKPKGATTAKITKPPRRTPIKKKTTTNTKSL